MLLADTSAWIEFFRDTGSPACEQLTDGLRRRDVVTTDPVILEVMAGARPQETSSVIRLLDQQRFEPVASRIDWLDAATIYRGCRRDGLTLRSPIDCLIAAIAIRADIPLLHHDRDFDAIAHRSQLVLA